MVKRHSDKIINTTQKGFTLIELLVVVAIIGILAAVGVLAFTGFMNSAKVNAVKANHQSVCKWTKAELFKCALDSSVSIFNGQITCLTIRSELNQSQQDAASEAAKELVKGLKGQFKNPYGAYDASMGDNAVTTAGWGEDRDLGYTIIEATTHSATGNARLNIHTCNKLPCIGEWWNNTNDNIEICWIEVQP